MSLVALSELLGAPVRGATGTGVRAGGRGRAGSSFTGVGAVVLSFAARARPASRKKWSGKLYDWSGMRDIS